MVIILFNFFCYKAVTKNYTNSLIESLKTIIFLWNS